MSSFRVVTVFLAVFTAAICASQPGLADTALDDLYTGRSALNGELATGSVHASPARAPTQTALATAPASVPEGQLFVQFQGELAYFPGNTSLIYGTLGPDGEPAQFEYASFQPAHGVLGLVMGSIIPWKSYVGGYAWDNVLPPMMSYRVELTRQQYRKLTAFIENTRRSGKRFYLYTDNCVRFVRDAARAIGLKAPEETFLLPPIYVNMLRIANSGHHG